ncbi:MAG TPA: hypothetical protein VFL80_07800 [Thermoanaerobaculia bacterium]|nr:hypothetical protein [Thermoanaerobaculia bacterium]
MIFLLVVLPACGEKKASPVSTLSKQPLSVRGWVADVDTGAGDSPTFRTVETEAARRTQVFQATQIWIDNAPYVSGGIAENGAFVLLDVPPGNVVIHFSAPGIADATLALESVPGNADVFIPAAILRPGRVEVPKADAIRVRVPANVPDVRLTQQRARVAGHVIPVQEVPARSMIDRRDFPNPPGFKPPVAVR